MLEANCVIAAAEHKQTCPPRALSSWLLLQHVSTAPVQVAGNWLFGLLPAWPKKDLNLPRFILEPSLHSSMDICGGTGVVGGDSEGMPGMDCRRQTAKLLMCKGPEAVQLQEISLKSGSPLIIIHCKRYILYMKQVLSPWDSYFQSHPLALIMCIHLCPLTTTTELVSQREQQIFITKLQPQDTK